MEVTRMFASLKQGKGHGEDSTPTEAILADPEGMTRLLHPSGPSQFFDTRNRSLGKAV